MPAPDPENSDPAIGADQINKRIRFRSQALETENFKKIVWHLRILSILAQILARICQRVILFNCEADASLFFLGWDARRSSLNILLTLSACQFNKAHTTVFSSWPVPWHRPASNACLETGLASDMGAA